MRLIELDESHRSEHTVFITPPEIPHLPNGEEHPKNYSYSGFPVLTMDLFDTPDGLLKTHRLSTKVAVPCSPSPMFRRTKQEIKSAHKIAKQYSSIPQMWSRCLLKHCYGLWFICLPAYVKVCHSKVRALRTAYDILRKMQAKKIESPDEVCYRVLMQLCGQYGQPVLAVKVLFEMKKAGVQPNAITYGYYNKAVLESVWPSGNRGGYFLWIKVRNVLHGVAQFKRALKKQHSAAPHAPPSDSSDLDAVSHGSMDSSIDMNATDQPSFSTDVTGTDPADDRSSTGGQSDLGYSSLSKEEVRRGAVHDIQEEQEDSRGSDSSSLSETESSKGSRDGLPQLLSPISQAGKSTSSIVRKEVKPEKMAETVGNAAGLLFASSFEDARESEVYQSWSLHSRRKGAMEPGLKDLSEWGTNNGPYKQEHIADLLIGGAEQEEKTGKMLHKLGADAKILSGALQNSIPRPKTLDIKRASPRKELVSMTKEWSDDESPVGEEGDTDKADSPVIFDLEDLDNDIVESKPQKTNDQRAKLLERSISTSSSISVFPAKPAEKTDVKVGLDPLSMLAAETEQEEETEDVSDKTLLTPSAKRDLAEEIEMYMNNMSSPLASRAPSMDLQRSTSDQYKSSKAIPLCRRSSLPSTPPQAPRLTKSKTYHVKREEKQRGRLWSSPASSLGSPKTDYPPDSTVALMSPTAFNFDTILTPKLDVLKSSMFSAGKGVAEKATKWYSKIANYTGPGKDQNSDRMSLCSSGAGDAESGSLNEDDFEGIPSSRDTDLTTTNYSVGMSRTSLESNTSQEGNTKQLYNSSSPSRITINYKTEPHSSCNSSSTTVFQNYAMEVLISSCSRCLTCDCLVHDEEIMAGWTADDSNLNTTCPFCGSPFLPFLNIEIRDLRRPGRYFLKASPSTEYMPIPPGPSQRPKSEILTPTFSLTPSSKTKSEESNVRIIPIPTGRRKKDGSESTSPSLPVVRSISTFSPLDEKPSCNLSHVSTGSLPTNFQTSAEPLDWRMSHPEPITVPYLSPLVVLKELESLLENEGDPAIAVPGFVDHHPIVFWNLVWYFRRLDLPSNLPGLILSSEHCNRHSKIPRTSMSEDSKHVLIQVLWDNLKLHQDPRQPLYILWNSLTQEHPLALAQHKQEETCNQEFLQGLVRSIKSNNVYGPMSQILESLQHSPKNPRQRSLYREILFLSLVALGRENIDIDVFDREYKAAYDRLTPEQVKCTQICDRPPSTGVTECRKTFGQPFL
ncbi:hypothetical protein GDO78_005171 [Eleutherodactylus coqui]|nr:hypothetical protein GDO78_005171 [Eleutherodactylus coqui]